MAEKQRTDILIENNTAVWDMRMEGAIHGTYAGRFRFRCYLSPTQQIAANRDFRELIGKDMYMADEHEKSLAYCLTQLKYRILESPPFWLSSAQASGVAGDIADENVLVAILGAAIDSEMIYRNQLQERKVAAIKRAKEAAEKILKVKDEVEADDDTSEEAGN